MKKIIVSIVMMGVVTGIFAQPTSPSNNQTNSVLIATCPHISEIKKNLTKGNWTATTKYGFWESYHRACSNDLTKFVGAQWVGANLGQVTCIYKADVQFDMGNQLITQPSFPVLLVYHALAHQPKGIHWKHMQHGVYNCDSQNQDDCAFAVNLEKQSGNIFEEAESLKSSCSNTPTPLNTD
ncbi:MAG: T4SS-associated protein EirA [Coxiellaceae bacterium]|nr:T4SS-associated protein EirA [Coxiellaceae bacterium]